jgi:hypothetical protein
MVVCNFVVDFDGPSGGLPTSDATVFVFYPIQRDEAVITLAIDIEGSYNGYNVPNRTKVDVEVDEELIGGRFESKFCSAFAYKFGDNFTACQCSCNVCNNGKGSQVNCDACVLIPANSTGVLLPPTDVNYPTTTNCIKIKE